MAPPRSFEVICEVEPATQPDLMHVRHQIGVLSRVATAFLIPDNHIGRATVSSIAVAHEVALMGGRAIACDLVEEIRDSQAFDGVHLIPVNRYRDVAHRLEAAL